MHTQWPAGQVKRGTVWGPPVWTVWLVHRLTGERHGKLRRIDFVDVMGDMELCERYFEFT